MEKLLKKSVEKLKRNIKKEQQKDLKLIINNKSYSSIPISDKNYYSIERKSSQKRFAFIDGGNQNIYSDSNFSLDAIRVYYSIFKEEKKVECKRYDFICITRINVDNNENVRYVCELLNENNITLSNQFLSFNPKDSTLKNGAFDAKTEDVARFVRRYLEIFIAKTVIEKSLDLYETIVLDGTLKQNIVNEKVLLDELKKAANSKKVLVCAVSKTTNVYTNSELQYNEALIFKSNNIKRFVYYPCIISNDVSHDAEIYFAKLHEKSNLVLRIELFKDDAKDVDITKFFSQVSFFAKDPIFLGYPYGLIDADKYARITNEETEFLKTIFLFRTNKEKQDVHAILDKMSF